MDTCSICLDVIKDKQLPITLSCTHRFHFTCFKTYMFKTKHTFYIDCPNCRQLNTRLELPFKDNYKNNLLALCHGSVGKVKCPCTTLQGLKCKKKSHLFNYGYCQFHNKDILPKCKYDIFCKYVYHLLECPNRTWETKLYLLDFTKKIIIKFPDKINEIQDIYRYLFVYIADAEKNEIENCYKDKTILYDYYDLELPPSGWINFCINRRVLF